MQRHLPLIAVGVGLNVVIGQLVAILKVPLYLDSIGTVLVAIVCGPWAGIAVGIAAEILAGIFFNPALPYYIPVACAIGGLAGVLARRGFFTTWPRVIVGGLLQAIVAAVISAPITAYVFGGVRPAGTTAVIAYLRATGGTLFPSVFFAGLGVEPVDKTLTYVVAFLIAKNLPRNLLERFPGAAQFRR